MAFLRKNFSYGVLAADISAVATQLLVKVGHTLPTSPGQFRVVIWNSEVYPNPADDLNTEIVTATYSGTPNLYNIDRAQEGTIAVGHTTNHMIALHYTAGMSEDDLNFLGTFEVDELGVGQGKTIVADLTGGLKKLVYSEPYTDALARAAISESIAGIDYNNITGVFSLTSGYVIPTTIEESNWNSAYGWGNHAGLYDVTGTAAGLVGAHESTYNHGNYNTAYSHSQLTSGNPHSVTPAELSLVIGTDVQAHGDVLDDLNILGANAADSEFLVGTGAGALAWESGATARTSIGLGTGNSPTFAGLTSTENVLIQKGQNSDTQGWINNPNDGASAQALLKVTAGSTSSNQAVFGVRGCGWADPVAFFWVANAIPIVLATTNTERVRVTGPGLMGLGTSTPVSKLSVHTPATVFNEPLSCTIFAGRRADGVVATIGIGYDATHCWNEDVTSAGQFQLWYYGGGSWVQKFLFDPNANFGIGQFSHGTNATNTLAIANGTPPTTSPENCFQIYSADFNAVANKACPHIRIEDNTIVRLNQDVSTLATPSFVRTILNQSVVDGAVPVLSLTQADVSEEFIKFIGTSANGVLTQSIVEAADVSTATLAGYVKIYVQDDGNQLTDQAYFIPVYTLT